MTTYDHEVSSVPVLFIVFNRPETTTKVFEAIRHSRPMRLYVASDGPRPEKGEEALCAEVRKITEHVDWPCDVKRLYRDENLGCKMAVSSAIDWFFENEEEGIILEDDCVPNQSFFPFCKAMLDRYRDDDHVTMISGTSLLPAKSPIRESYFFTRYFIIWGWATWRRAWEKYDIEMKEWPKFRDNGGMYRIYPNHYFAHRIEDLYQETYIGKIDTWDPQWFLSCHLAGGVVLMPRMNLVSNIGPDGIHSDGTRLRLHFLPTEDIKINDLVHPEKVSIDIRKEKRLIKNVQHLFGYNWLKDHLYIPGVINAAYSLLRGINRKRWRYARFRFE